MSQRNDFPVLNMEEVGNRIKKLRKERNLKVTDISDRMGFESPQAVYKWQRGECLPEIMNLIVLSRMLGTTVEGIVLGEEGCPFLISVSNYIMNLRNLLQFNLSPQFKINKKLPIIIKIYQIITCTSAYIFNKIKMLLLFV